jgi:hypothetical protein
MGNDDVVFYINKWNNKCKFTKVYEKMGKKFDLVIQNPPYDRDLHLQILEAILPHAKKVVNISPVNWLQDPFAVYSTRSAYNRFQNTISTKIETIDIIAYKDATKLFDGALFTSDLGIYVCGNGGYAYQHSNPVVNKIINKVRQHNWLPYSPKKYYQGLIAKKQYSLDIAPIRINDTNEIERIMCKTYAAQCQTQPMNKSTAYDNQGGHFEFDTENERVNFYLCYNHPFMKWYCHLWKSNSHVYSGKLPYFDDYTHSWNLKDFFTWFNLTKEEQTYVVKEIRKMRYDKMH